MARTPSPHQVAIGNGQTINADAAAYLFALARRVQDEIGVVLEYTAGTRTYAEQLRLYNGYRAGAIDPRTGKRFNPAWHPDDPRANHMGGEAVDFASGVGYITTPASRLVHRIAREYAWEFDVPGEPWHARFRPDWAKPLAEMDDMFNETDRKNLEFVFNILVLEDSAADGVKGGIRHTVGRTWEVVKALQEAQASRYALVRQKGRAEVFLSVDRQELRWIESESSLKDQLYTLQSFGFVPQGPPDSPAQEVDNLSAFGTIIGTKPKGY